MRRRTILKAAGLTGLAMVAGAGRTASRTPQDSGLREHIRLHDGWRFHLGHAADLTRDFGFGRYQRTFAKVQEDAPPATMADFDDQDWASVQVPHDWTVTLPFAQPRGPLPSPGDRLIKDRVSAHGFKAIGREFPENSVGWYRLPLPVGPDDRNRRLWLEFDGVFRDSMLFVNGCIVGESASGYAPFRVDLSDFLDYDGPNVLTVRVDASLGEGWFYEGAGIYRHVHLVKADLTHVPQWGTVVRAEPRNGGAHIEVATQIARFGSDGGDVRLRRTVMAPDGSVAARLPDVTVSPEADGTITNSADIPLDSARLWSPADPAMYSLVTEIWAGDRVVDRTRDRFGIRSIAFDADRGFLLNGAPVKLLGACNHQDHAGVGSALPDRLHAWRVEQMQGMGCNAWRSAHNPPAEALLDICDDAGMMMIVELRRNTTDAEALGELDRVIRRDRNHPCVILWSTGNEEPQQGTDRGRRITTELKRRIKALDPTRPVNQAFYHEDKGYGVGAWDVVDVAGLNYYTDQADAFHRQFPRLPILGTETGSTVATRGEYQNDAARHLVRAYDTEHPFWASTAEEWWPLVAERPWFGGGFIWTGFDYRGEPTPYPEWPSVTSQFGVMDLCGFPKDNYWYYRAWWRPQEDVVHLLPHWNWEGKEGQPIEVWAHGNGEEAELFLNGRSLGRRPIPRNRHASWSVPYAPGRLEVRSYRGGRVVARDMRETAGAPAALRIVSDRDRLKADGQDVAMIRVEVVDRAGRIVPRAGDMIRFSMEGPVRLIGVGNGNPNSHEPEQAPYRHAFNGLAQAIIQSTGAPGAAMLVASADGLRSAHVGLIAQAVDF